MARPSAPPRLLAAPFIAVPAHAVTPRASRIFQTPSRCRLPALPQRCLPPHPVSLRCSKCDFRVIRFCEDEWDGSVDYMFFRNFMPDRAKLSAKLRPKEGSSAYACQCAWASVQAGARNGLRDEWFACKPSS